MSRPPIILPLVFAGLAFTAATFLVSDTDVFWVSAAGRWMLNHHAVPRENLWSITEPTHPWVFHEWLFGVPFAWLMEHVGVGGLPLLTLAMVTAVFGFSLRFTRHRPWLFALAVVCFSMRLVTPRPTHLALLFPFWLWWLLDAPLTRGRVVSVLLVEWLWANSHGSFVVGWALIALKLFEVGVKRSRWVALLAGAIGITLLNPYGVGLHALVADYFAGASASAQVIHEHIREFRPLWSDGDFLYSRATAALVVVLAAACRALWLPAFRARALLVIALIVQAVLHVRHRELAGLLGCVLLLPAWPSKTHAPSFSNAWVLVPGLLLGLGCWGAAWLRHRSDEEWVSRELGGADVVTLARALPDDARVVTEFPASGLVLWYGAERGVRVLMDARNDCYSAETAKLAFDLEDGAAPISRLSEIGVTHALVRDDSPLAVLNAEQSAGAWSIRRVP